MAADTPEATRWHEENASVEVWRWGDAVRVAIRSAESVGKAIELSRADARELAGRLTEAANDGLRRVKDEPQA